MGGGNEQKGNDSSYPLFAERPVGVPKTSILKGRIEPFYKSGQYYKVNLQAYGKPPTQMQLPSTDLSHLGTCTMAGTPANLM
jgi:hypothetical protein